jgi:TRAP transporter T-component
MKTFLNALICLTLLMVLFSASLQARQEEPPSTLLTLGDELYKERADLDKCREAINHYEEAFAETPREEIAVRLGKAYYWLGGHLPEETRAETFQKGLEWSRKAIELDLKSVGGHFWLGVNQDKLAETRGMLKNPALVKSIEEEMEKVIKLNPGYEGGGPHRVLGRLYFKLPRSAGGSIPKSLSNLRKAIEYSPRRLLNRLFIAEVYLALKQHKQAEMELHFILNTPPEPGCEPEGLEDKAAARKLLEELNENLKDYHFLISLQ